MKEKVSEKTEVAVLEEKELALLRNAVDNFEVKTGEKIA